MRLVSLQICKAKEQRDGSVNVMTKGVQRFRILSVWTQPDGAVISFTSFKVDLLCCVVLKRMTVRMLSTFCVALITTLPYHFFLHECGRIKYPPKVIGFSKYMHVDI